MERPPFPSAKLVLFLSQPRRLCRSSLENIKYMLICLENKLILELGIQLWNNCRGTLPLSHEASTIKRELFIINIKIRAHLEDFQKTRIYDVSNEYVCLKFFIFLRARAHRKNPFVGLARFVYRYNM